MNIKEFYLQRYERKINPKDVINKMAAFYRSHGFKRKSNLFYKIQGNIAYCIRFECPSAVHVHFYIVPLYIRHEHDYLTYGSRLDGMWVSYDPPKRLLDPLYFYSETNECDEWIEKLKVCSENVIFPHFEEIGSDQKLMDTLNKGDYVYNYWHNGCNEFFLYRLRAYTNFVLSDYDAALEDIKIAHDMIDKLEYTALELRNGWHDEMNVLEEMTRATEEERQLFINNNIEYTIEHCFKPKKRK